MELLVAHEGGLQRLLPFSRGLANLVPAHVGTRQPVAQLVRPLDVLRVVGQMSPHDVQADDDALVAVEVEEELAVVLDHVLQLFDVRRGRALFALRALRELQPLLQPPQVVVQLGPIAVRTQRTRQATAVTENSRTTRVQ